MRVSNKLRGLKNDKHQSQADARRAEMLETLKLLYPGVFGRLVDRCKSIQRKYNMSADLFADWKKEEESLPNSRGGNGFDSGVMGSGGGTGGVYDTPYGGNDTYGNEGSINDDFEFETVGEDGQSLEKEEEKPCSS
ncbi:hypothetical protein PsorP6_011080 [Peronosclerospora sorghi]|uniref:Uncharacterized protein n=1 Tax=Peronosclerospora sorghi TaxID=230839 RepID=A0ACC0VU36_9STRA|nr:hypothetical protein PsorP6_011080 [Peronosclerospora sorghi]